MMELVMTTFVWSWAARLLFVRVPTPIAGRAGGDSASVADRRRCLSRLWSGDRLREGAGRAGADHGSAAIGGPGLRVAEAAVPPLRRGLHRPAPAEAGQRNYAATAASMITLLKYDSGLPFNRPEGLQGIWRYRCRPRRSGTWCTRWRRPSRRLSKS